MSCPQALLLGHPPQIICSVVGWQYKLLTLSLQLNLCFILTEVYSGIEGEAVHFYGNDGVCVFKFLVTKDDPQRLYSLILLGINFVCFVIISACYIFISVSAYHSSKATGRNDNSKNRFRRDLQLKVSAIIMTDFLCWIPLTAVCFLHYGDVIDATKWYPFFSIVLLPINSVINPLLYNGDLIRMLAKPARILITQTRGITGEIEINWSTRRNTVQAEINQLKENR